MGGVYTESQERTGISSRERTQPMQALSETDSQATVLLSLGYDTSKHLPSTQVRVSVHGLESHSLPWRLFSLRDWVSTLSLGLDLVPELLDTFSKGGSPLGFKRHVHKKGDALWPAKYEEVK